MKLTATQIKQVEDQLDANPIPEDHPAAPQLKNAFGDHTFYLHPDGLHIVEMVEKEETGQPVANVVKVASWASEERNSLVPHEPQPTTVFVDVSDKDPDSAA